MTGVRVLSKISMSELDNKGKGGRQERMISKSFRIA